jgi:hypothetical protein
LVSIADHLKQRNCCAMNPEMSNTETVDIVHPSFGDRVASVRPLKGSKQRSAVTNGTTLLPGVDGRSAWIRRCKDLIAEHLVDFGGEDNASAAERSIIRRACVLTVELEQLEAKFASAGQSSTEDLDLYQRTAGGLRRLLEAIGIQRRPRDVTPTLTEYLTSTSDVEPSAAETEAEVGE